MFRPFWESLINHWGWSCHGMGNIWDLQICFIEVVYTRRFECNKVAALVNFISISYYLYRHFLINGVSESFRRRRWWKDRVACPSRVECCLSSAWAPLMTKLFTGGVRHYAAAAIKDHHPVLSPSYSHPHMYPPLPSETPQFCFDQSTLQLYGGTCDRGRLPGGKSHDYTCDHCRSLPTAILGLHVHANTSPNTFVFCVLPIYVASFCCGSFLFVHRVTLKTIFFSHPRLLSVPIFVFTIIGFH